MSGKLIEVLLAEDNPGDVRLTRDALRKSVLPMNLSVVSDGEEAMAYLRREGSYAKAARPHLMILDLNMPRKGGREVLAEMRRDPSLDCIPVVVFTSSEAEEDIISSYKLHASCFVSKPSYVEQFNSTVKGIEDFWLRFAKLPPHCGCSEF